MKMKDKIKSTITLLSCNHLLRVMFPFFADWYAGFVVGDKEKKTIVSTQAVGWYRFFNVQGGHRRGDFRKDQFRERLVLLVDFRQVEVPCQRLADNV